MCQGSLHGEKGKSKNNVTISSRITLVKHSPHELLIPLLFQIVNWTGIEAKSNVTCLRLLREPKLEASDAYIDGRKCIEDF